METRPGKANPAGRELASWRERSRRKRMWRGVSAFLSMAHQTATGMRARVQECQQIEARRRQRRIRRWSKQAKDRD